MDWNLYGSVLYFVSAQRLGLMERPPELLTEAEWQQVKHQSQQREDSAAPCVICKEDFGTQEQVMLVTVIKKDDFGTQKQVMFVTVIIDKAMLEIRFQNVGRNTQEQVMLITVIMTNRLR